MQNFPEPIKLEPLTRKARKAPTAAPRQRRARTSAPTRKSPAAQPRGLAALRERNGVSINDIAERTRIPLHHLEELERGDISQWPAGVYAKSWAREYAIEAGLDPDQVIALVAPVAAVEPSIEEIKQAREQGETLAAGLRQPMVELMKKAAAVVAMLVLLAIAAAYL
ncbi:MAG: helix-turn-helix domain-containing protein [Acidobacteriota bacterium]|nr:helix-turn-helix domain-containing protein [Acidobacteriota bacterium]